jgi:hypothetical protein
MEQERRQNEHNESQDVLKQFRGEIASFAAGEARGEIESGHFLVSGAEIRTPEPGFDASELTEEDREIWEIKDRTVTLEGFREYARGIAGLDKNDPATSSRVIFSQFAANMVPHVIWERVNDKKE